MSIFLQSSSVKNETNTDKDHEVFISKKPPASRKSRWLILGLACLMTFGSSFCFDSPQPLQLDIESYLNVSNSEYNLLYSVYSIPNLIFPFLSGLVIDSLGIRIAIIGLSLLVAVGQTILFSGAYYLNFHIMLLGRFILGMGAESLGVARSALLAKWFAHKELGFAMGVASSSLFIGNSLNSFTATRIFTWIGELYVPFLVGAILCLCSWFFSLAIALLDFKPTNEDISLEGKRHSFRKAGFKGLKYLGANYFILVLSSFLLYGALFGLRDNLNDILSQKFYFSPQTAGFLILFVYAIPATLTPFMGIMIDRSGQRILIVLGFSLFFVLELIYLTFVPEQRLRSPITIIPGLIAIGLFHSAFAAMFMSSIPRVLETKDSGIAYGIAVSFQNLVQGAIPLIIGRIHDKTLNVNKGYFWSLIPLVFLGVFGIITLISLYFNDKRTGERLNRIKSHAYESELVSLDQPS